VAFPKDEKENWEKIKNKEKKKERVFPWGEGRMLEIWKEKNRESGLVPVGEGVQPVRWRKEGGKKLRGWGGDQIEKKISRKPKLISEGLEVTRKKGHHPMEGGVFEAEKRRDFHTWGGQKTTDKREKKGKGTLDGKLVIRRGGRENVSNQFRDGK